jgi:hypothetical protein
VRLLHFPAAPRYPARWWLEEPPAELSGLAAPGVEDTDAYGVAQVGQLTGVSRRKRMPLTQEAVVGKMLVPGKLGELGRSAGGPARH